MTSKIYPEETATSLLTSDKIRDVNAPSPPPPNTNQPASLHGRIESYGVWLPRELVSARHTTEGMARSPALPLEKMTGIRQRRVASGLGSRDLARLAVRRCLDQSRYGPGDIDLVLSCSITAMDRDGRTFHTEPGLARLIAAEFLPQVRLAFDLSNACAGMFTGIWLADALIRCGRIRRALVFSGEYITHLTDVARAEISSLRDDRLACLTLADSGAAMIIDGTRDAGAGFLDIRMETFGEHSDLCTARITREDHGGWVMHTDSIRLAGVAIDHSVRQTGATLSRHHLGWEDLSCVIPHQVSRPSLRQLAGRIRRRAIGPGPVRVVENFADVGNTSSTTHLLALDRTLREGSLHRGDRIGFMIQASGLTVGTALYQFDELPGGGGTDRQKPAEAGPEVPPPESWTTPPGTAAIRLSPPVVLAKTPDDGRDSIGLALEPAMACPAEAGDCWLPPDLLIHAGVYKTDFLKEPSHAALLGGGLLAQYAGLLAPGFFAFDLVGGATGWLAAVALATDLIRGGQRRAALITASEDDFTGARGIRSAGSAVLLAPRGRGPGLGQFAFYHGDDDGLDFSVTESNHSGSPEVQLHRRSGNNARLQRFFLEALADYLSKVNLKPTDCSAVIAPCLPELRRVMGRSFGWSPSRFSPTGEQDWFTSTIPHALHGAAPMDPDRPVLITTVGAGSTAAFALAYRPAE